MSGLVAHVLFFLSITLVTTLVTSAIRLRAPRDIARETLRYFLMVTAGIGLLSGIVVLLEWMFVRPLI